MQQQLEMFAPGLAQQFEAWKETPGGRHVLQQAYRLAAVQGARWVERGRPGSVALLWEQLRDRFAWVTAQARRKGVSLDKWQGFSLNNNFRAYVARHMMDRRPDWRGMFEVREVGKVRKKRKVVVIEERIAA